MQLAGILLVLTRSQTPSQRNNVYEDKIRTMMEKGETRLLVDVADLRDADSKLCEQVPPLTHTHALAREFTPSWV